jgi:hypothetical protein
MLPSCRRAATTALRCSPQAKTAARRLGGHGHSEHHPPAPPSFARLPAPDSPVHEERELLWDDPVAPEMALDFDAPEISKWKGLAMWLAGLGFFAVVGLVVKVVLDPPSKKPTVKRVLDVDAALGNYARKA